MFRFQCELEASPGIAIPSRGGRERRTRGDGSVEQRVTNDQKMFNIRSDPAKKKWIDTMCWSTAKLSLGVFNMFLDAMPIGDI